jgi:hypothetical protein
MAKTHGVAGTASFGRTDLNGIFQDKVRTAGLGKRILDLQDIP